MENKFYTPENQADKKLEKILGKFERDFSDDFSKKVMEQIAKKEFKVLQPNSWDKSFKRIVIPAAAVLVMMLAFSLYNNGSLTEDQVTGVASLTSESSSSLILNVYGY